MNILSFLKSRKSYKLDIIITFLIVCTPFVFYLYRIVPNNIKVWKTKWFTIKSFYHDDVEYFFWIISVKILTLVILTLWYFTCSYRWKHIIFIPIIFEIYKIFINVYYDIFNLIDTGAPFLNSLFVSIPYIIVLWRLTLKVDYSQQEVGNSHMDLNVEINNELDSLSKFDDKNYRKVKKDFRELLSNNNKLTKKEYLTQLIALRDRLTVD